MIKFVNRKKELGVLEKEFSRDGSSFVVVYGRRRVGKTTLITEFLKKHESSLYFLATEESETQNLKAFKKMVGDFTGNALIATAEVDWEATFQVLTSFNLQSKKIIVMDEFQYIGQSNSAFPSIIQKIWDTLLKDSNVMLILCGSLVSLMKSQVLDFSSPLYGRRTAQIKLKQIPFKDYHEFFENKSNLELLPFYAVTGGVPKYIEAFRERDEIFEGIEENILSSQSFLYEEPYFLLQKEVTEIGSYFSLMKAIAMGNRKLENIAGYMGVKSTNLPKYLQVLMDLDLVERQCPITEKLPEKSKKGLYRITDNFVAFWFKFVYPHQGSLEKGETKFVMSQIENGFIQNFVSFVFEDVCRERMWDLCGGNLWSFSFDKVGSFWGKETEETDIVAIDSFGKNLIIGECKFSKSPKGLSTLHKLESKAHVLKKITETTHVEFVIFCTGGFTGELKELASERNDVKLIETI